MTEAGHDQDHAVGLFQSYPRVLDRQRGEGTSIGKGQDLLLDRGLNFDALGRGVRRCLLKGRKLGRVGGSPYLVVIIVHDP